MFSWWHVCVCVRNISKLYERILIKGPIVPILVGIRITIRIKGSWIQIPTRIQ